MIRKKTGIAGLSLALSLVGRAATYNTTTNWSSKTFAATDTNIITANATVWVDASSTCGVLRVNNQSSPATGTLKIANNFSLTVGTLLQIGTGTGAGIVTQSAGAVTAQQIQINQSGTGDLSRYDLSGGTVAGTTSVQINTNGLLSISGGVMTTPGLNVYSNGSVSLKGGTLEMNGTFMNNGTVTIDGGALESTYNGTTRTISGTGKVEIKSGIFNLAGTSADRIYINSRLFEISGGNVNLGGQVWVGDGGAAEFKVVGSTAVINLTTLNQQASTAESGIFRFVFDSAGVSPIRSGGFMNLSAASLIVDGSAYTGSGGTFTLFDAVSLNMLLDTNNITLTGFESFPNARVVQDQTADKVQLILEEDLSLLSNDDYNKYRLNKLKFAVTLDVDQNGVLSISEYTDASPSFVSLDKDGNGSITFAEYNALVNPDSVNWSGLSLRNVLYKQLGQYRALLDVHYPSSSVPSEPVPAVVFIHGGGWVTGSKEKFDTASFLPVFEKLAAKGVICVAIDYRLVFFDGDNVFMRDCVIDVRDALRFLKKNAAVLGINPDRIAVFGESAGAQLAMMGALSAPGDFVGVAELSDYAFEPCAAVSWYGPVDFTDTNLFVVASDPSINPNRWDGRIGGLRTENPELFTEMSPRFYLKAASSPLLLVHGTEDTTIPVIHSHVMVDQAGAAGASVGFIEVAHSGHNWIPVGGTLDPSVAVIQQQTAGFLLSCLFPQSYADWTAGFGLTGEQASYTADPDGDGASNLNEYAFHGGWPTIKNEQGTLSVFAKIRGVDSRGLEYVYRRRRDAAIRGLSYRLETTTDLVSSVWGTNAVTETGTGTIDADFEQVTNRIETGTSGFVRLNIGLNP